MPLTLVPTPIGNLEDITLRALIILREADLIACEDTRTSGILLRKYNINTKTISFHLYNENQRINFLLDKLKEGKKLAVTSDAGTPGISDPGWILLKKAIDEGIEVDVLPGASAVLPAVLMSGIVPQPFMFMGFPPEKFGERQKFFDSVKNFPYTMCFYISPHKIEKQISEMIEIFGDRKAALIREISKIFQEAIREDLSKILQHIQDGIKGELVLVVEGHQQNFEEEKILWQSEVQDMLKNSMSVKDITNFINQKYEIPKNEIKKYINNKGENFNDRLQD